MSLNADPTSKRLTVRLRDFFYRQETPYSLALMRMAMPLVLLGVMLPRWFRAREIYSSDGAPCPLSLVYGMPDLLPTFSGGVVVFLHTILIFALIASCLGWCTRLSLGISTTLYIYLNMMDSVSTMTKYSVIASHAMLLLTLSQCGAVWSIDAWLKGRKRSLWPGDTSQAPKFEVWPQRLIQLMIGIVYIGAAMTKMHTPEFFSGDQMTYWMLSHVNFANPGGEILSQFPSIVVASAYLVIVWEVLFLFLAWKGWGRICMIAMGLMFHVMTTVTLGLYVFPMVCSVIYLSFLGEADIQRGAAFFRRVKRKWGLSRKRQSRKAFSFRPATPQWQSLCAFAGTIVMVGSLGLIVEHLCDPYGIRRSEGLHTLREIDPAVAAKWLSRTEPIRKEDKIFAFDLGSFMVGDSLSNRRKVFEPGDVLIAQVSLNPPHEDLYVECNLHDAEDRIIMRYPAVLRRETFRGHFTYRLTSSLPPGEYQLVLSTAGSEITRRSFQLTGEKNVDASPRAVSAN